MFPTIKQAIKINSITRISTAKSGAEVRRVIGVARGWINSVTVRKAQRSPKKIIITGEIISKPPIIDFLTKLLIRCMVEPVMSSGLAGVNSALLVALGNMRLQGASKV